MKKNKKDLMPDTVKSDTIHFGIELELIAPCDGEESHDDDACYENQLQYYRDCDALRDYISLTRDEADQVRPYFDQDKWADDMMDGWYCDDDECSYRRKDASATRDEIEKDLTRITGNNSFKVVDDGSISCDENSQCDAEVCWNFHASKDTIKDNEKILGYLKRRELKFNNSCGLHINLNNYLKVKQCRVERSKLEFLFNLVAPSRKSSTYCRSFGIAHDEKYSMIYNQRDRLEFRFFSPTLDADKLHHYIVTAHVIYKRLAGIDAKLPKKTAQYLLTKMMTVNKLPETVAIDTLDKLNSIEPIEKLEMARRVANELPF